MQILSDPHIYDIVLSDFGRAATVRLLADLADGERTRIQQILAKEGDPREAPFFDEHRRIMGVSVGDVAYIKQDLLLERQKNKSSLLDSSVLYGVKGTTISDKAIGRIVDIFAGQVKLAFGHGHRRFRLVIPCNTLAFIEDNLARDMRERFPGIEVRPFSINNGIGHPGELKKKGELTIYTVPKAVLKYVNSVNSKAELMLVGTALAREEYKRALTELELESISIIDVSPEGQSIMDELLVASIGGDEGYVKSMRDELKQKVLKQYHATTVIEASTDFAPLGIGINSLKMFAELLLDEVYGPIGEGRKEEDTR